MSYFYKNIVFSEYLNTVTFNDTKSRFNIIRSFFKINSKYIINGKVDKTNIPEADDAPNSDFGIVTDVVDGKVTAVRAVINCVSAVTCSIFSFTL